MTKCPYNFPAKSRADKHVTLAATIRDNCTSYDGFMSFYSNDLGSWLAKPLRQWDHNELEILLIACCKIAGWRDPQNDIFEHMTESNDFDQAHDGAVDWNKFEAKAAERRADKVAELRAADPDYVPPAVRCPDTLDMFRK